MAKARRAFLEEDDYDVLDITPSAVTSPRREAKRPRILGRVLAPIALSGLVVAGSFAIASKGNSDKAAAPSYETTDLGVSRGGERAPLASASPSGDTETSTPAPLPTPTETPEATPTETATPTEEVTATASPTKTFDPSELGEKTGEMYIASSANVRTGPGSDYDVRTTLDAGLAVTITNVTSNGWQQISYKGRAGWVKSDLLTSKKPETPSTSPSSESGGSGSGGGASSGGTCSSSSAKSIESGLTSKSISVLHAVCAAFPDVKSYGGYRNDSGYHGQGRAIDVMVSGDRAWEIARWLRENAKSLGVIEVIHAQKIWTTQRSSEGWRSMSDRGSATANHYDHVHISVGG
mgnify:CR=1 FL=1